MGKAIPKKPAGDQISQDISITDSLHQPFWLRNQHEAVCRLVTDLNMKRFACRHQSGSGGSTCQGADRCSHHVKKLKAALLGRLAQEVSLGCGKNVEEDGLVKTGRMAK